MKNNVSYKIGHLVSYTAYFTNVKPKGEVYTITGYIKNYKGCVYTVEWFNHPSGQKTSRFHQDYMSSLKIIV